jgi:hypothetical protein
MQKKDQATKGKKGNNNNDPAVFGDGAKIVTIEFSTIPNGKMISHTHCRSDLFMHTVKTILSKSIQRYLHQAKLAETRNSFRLGTSSSNSHLDTFALINFPAESSAEAPSEEKIKSLEEILTCLQDSATIVFDFMDNDKKLTNMTTVSIAEETEHNDLSLTMHLLHRKLKSLHATHCCREEVISL